MRLYEFKRIIGKAEVKIFEFCPFNENYEVYSGVFPSVPMDLATKSVMEIGAKDNVLEITVNFHE